MHSHTLLALAASLSSASAAAVQGFNYGSTTDFATAFATQKQLAGTNGQFTSARLYTTIDPAGGPINAIPAAISSKTTLLLGLWASAGQANIDNEIAALKSAIATYGSAFADLVTGISVGSEDLYRISPTGIINKSGVGAGPAEIVSYIKQVRAAVAGTVLANAPIGHVDTWTAFVNGSNSDVIANCDFLGTDAYPYFQSTQANGIENGASLFFSAYDQVVAASQGKAVWVTETGWPTSGPDSGAAVPSVENAQTYWDAVACKLLGTTNTYWYTLADAGASPSFGVSSSISDSTPLYNLTCSASTASSSSAVASSTATASSSGAQSASTSASASASSASVVATVSAVPSAVGGGSPQAQNSAGFDSSIASVMTAMPSAYSSALQSAASNAAVASSISLATTTGGAIIRTTGTAAASSTKVASAGAASGTKTAAAGSYTGAASANGPSSIGGIVGAMIAAVALL